MNILLTRDTSEGETAVCCRVDPRQSQWGAGVCGRATEELESLLTEISEGDLTDLYGYDAVALVAAAVLELGMDEEHAREALWMS